MKKTLSIILAIIMLLSVCPVAFAADETPDFSNAKILTGVNGKLYIDGVEATTVGSYKVLPTGKYKLTGDITTTVTLRIEEGENVALDLNGYTWDLGDKNLNINGTLSVYDTSSEQTGKIVSTRSGVVGMDLAKKTLQSFTPTAQVQAKPPQA